MNKTTEAAAKEYAVNKFGGEFTELMEFEDCKADFLAGAEYERESRWNIEEMKERAKLCSNPEFVTNTLLSIESMLIHFNETLPSKPTE